MSQDSDIVFIGLQESKATLTKANSCIKSARSDEITRIGDDKFGKVGDTAVRCCRACELDKLFREVYANNIESALCEPKL